MQTRQKKNLSKVSINDLLLPQTMSVRREKRIRIEKKFEADYEIILNEKNKIIKQQQELISNMLSLNQGLEKMPIASQPTDSITPNENVAIESLIMLGHSEASIHPPKNRKYLILDTESFYYENILLPIQIACGIYEWNEQENLLIKLDMFTAYVYETYNDSEFVHASLTYKCLTKHENNRNHKKINTMSASYIFEEMDRLIQVYSVYAIVAYNISWDFMAISNLAKIYGDHNAESVCTAFDATCDNPFNRYAVHYLDLMHEVVKKYGSELIYQGIKDGIIFRSADNPNKLQISKKEKFQTYSRSIYSAAYVLNFYFSISQSHLAQQDVTDEALILEKCLKQFGASNLEYNICYPQVSCYQRILKLANKLYTDESECLFE